MERMAILHIALGIYGLIMSIIVLRLMSKDAERDEEMRKLKSKMISLEFDDIGALKPKVYANQFKLERLETSIHNRIINEVSRMQRRNERIMYDNSCNRRCHDRNN